MAIMPRPKKPPGSKKSIHLRIPLTPDQHKRIGLAAGDEGMAAWARTILLSAAEKQLDAGSARTVRKKA